MCFFIPKVQKVKKKIKIISPAFDLPASINLVLSFHKSLAEVNGRKMAHFILQEIPISLNHQKKHVIFKSKISGKAVRSEALKKEVHDFRAKAHYIIKEGMKDFTSSGTCAAIIGFESPRWITKAGGIRVEDVDNKVKPIFDAIQKSFPDFKDETVWEFHAFKMLGAKDAVHVWIFDLGDTVESY